MAGETQCVCGLTYPSPSPPCTLRGVPPARTTGLRRCRSSPPAVSPVTTRLTKGSTSAALLKAPVGSESDGDPGCVREGPEECLPDGLLNLPVQKVFAFLLTSRAGSHFFSAAPAQILILQVSGYCPPAGERKRDGLKRICRFAFCGSQCFAPSPVAELHPWNMAQKLVDGLEDCEDEVHT